MTEKRFTKTSKNGYWQIKDNQADYKETFDLTNPQLIVDRLNALHEENIKVLSLIDKKIDDLQRTYDLGQKEGFCPMHNIMHSINVLKEIKKEMGWE